MKGKKEINKNRLVKAVQQMAEAHAAIRQHLKKEEAKAITLLFGIDFEKELHLITLIEAELLGDLAKICRYEKPIDAHCSKVHCFFMHLKNVSSCALTMNQFTDKYGF